MLIFLSQFTNPKRVICGYSDTSVSHRGKVSVSCYSPDSVYVITLVYPSDFRSSAGQTDRGLVKVHGGLAVGEKYLVVSRRICI